MTTTTTTTITDEQGNDPMTMTAPTTGPTLATSRLTGHRPTTPTGREHGRALPAVLRSEWIKLTTIRSNAVILGLTAIGGGVGAWATAVLVTDEVLTVAQVFIYSTVLTAVVAAVVGILLLSSEAQHGTLASALTARPGRVVLAAGKTIVAAAFGAVLGAVGMAAGFAGAVLGGLELGDTSGMAATVAWALLYTSMSAVLGLGVGMVVRHSAGAIAGLLVWWMVVETMVLLFLPAELARFLPFEAGYRLLDMESDLDTPEMLAVVLTRPQYALVFAGYTAVALTVGTALLSRRDTT